MKTRLRTLLGCATLFAAFLALARPATGLGSWPLQDEEETADEGGEGEEDEDGDDDDDDGERFFAIVGGDVYTGTGAVLRRATILSRNGVIREIGHDPYLPEGTEILDATGMRVYPGLVALGAASHVTGGLFSSGGPDVDDHDPHFGLDDTARSDEGEAVRRVLGHFGDDYEPPMQAEAEGGVADTFDPFSQYMVMALAAGITTAEQSNSAVKLKRGEIEGVVMNEKNLVSIVWSVSSPSAIRSAREKFEKASVYLRKLRAWEDLSEKAKKARKEPSKKGVDSSTLKVLRGDLLARFNANDREDLHGIASFAQEYRFRPVIYGCREGWTVAEELGRAGAIAIVTPRDRQPKDEELVRPGGSSIENAAILSAAGVQVAIKPSDTSINLSGIAGRDLLHLPIEAAFGVRGGLSEEAALASITIVPARILGVDHRIGTLEVGKDLDAIVTDGDVLHYETFVQYAVVHGKQVYDKQEELIFSHIRPRVRTPEEPEPAVEPEPEPEPVPEEQADDAEEEEEDDDEGAEEEDEGFEEEDEDPGARAR